MPTISGDMMHRRGFLLFSAGLLAACETRLDVPHYAEITFAHRPAILLNVAEVKIIQAYQSPGVLPNVEHEFPVPPGRMATRWARDRLRATGPSGELVFTIRDASVVEIPLEKQTGVSGLVTVDQSERYEARLVVEIRANDVPGGLTADSVSTVKRRRTVAEDVTLNDREGIWYAMTEDMARDLDGQLEAALTQYFSGFLR